MALKVVEATVSVDEIHEYIHAFLQSEMKSS